jgi:hypothetical protein
MRNKILLAALVLASLLGVSFIYQNQSHTKWEYKTIITTKGGEKELAALGDEGWELTATTYQPAGLGGVTVLYMKRQK